MAALYIMSARVSLQPSTAGVHTCVYGDYKLDEITVAQYQ